jgi:hypothetical protein
VAVDETDFGWRDACVLQFHGRALFAAEDDDGCTFDADGAGACGCLSGYSFKMCDVDGFGECIARTRGASLCIRAISYLALLLLGHIRPERHVHRD